MANRNRFVNSNNWARQNLPSMAAFEANFGHIVGMNAATAGRGNQFGGTEKEMKKLKQQLKKELRNRKFGPISNGMSAAVQTWFIKFLKKGHPPNEAKQMAIEHLKTKREMLSQKRRAKYAKLEEQLEDELGDNVVASGRNVNPRGIQVAVLPPSYPNEMLKDNELSHLQEIILDEILGGDHSVKIQFNDLQLRPGFMVFYCRNAATHKWLENTVSKLSTACSPSWKGPQITTRTGPAIPRTFCITLLLPNCENEAEIRNMLSFLGEQNQSLKINCWKILTHNKQSDGTLVTVAIDDASLNSIKESNLIIHHKFGRIPVHVSRNTYEEVYKECETIKVNKMKKKQLKRKSMQIAKELAEHVDSNNGEDDDDDEYDDDEDDDEADDDNEFDLPPSDDSMDDDDLQE